MPFNPIEKSIRKLSKVKSRLVSYVPQIHSSETRQQFEKDVSLIETAIEVLKRGVNQERAFHTTRVAILKKELERDLLDRDANDAKVVERYRMAADRGDTFANVLLKSKDSTRQIESELLEMCPWYKTRVCKPVRAFQK
jgi:hypothetical protein